MKRVSFFSFIVLFLVSTMINAKQETGMKTAVASNSKQPTSHVSTLAGRSPLYLIFDSTGIYRSF